MANVKQLVSKASIMLRKNAPTIMTVSGVGCMIGGTVFAIRATSKVEPVLDACKKDIEDLKIPETVELEDGTTKELEVDKKAVAQAYLKTGLEISKLYWPMAALTVGGAGLILAGHHIGEARLASAMSAYGVLKTCYDDYRDRVREVLGDKKEERIFYGLETETAKERNDETGKLEKKEFDIVSDADEVPWHSPYARRWNEVTAPGLFDPRDGLRNKQTLEQVQLYYNERLRVKGHVFLNEVWNALGLKEIPEGQLVGWVFDPDCNDEPMIDLGIREYYVRSAHGEGMQVFRDEIVLDPNVQGMIYDLL